MEIDNKKITVGYSTITIKKQQGQFIKDNMTDTYGQYLPREHAIEIQPNLINIDEANTLLHELLHACVWTASLSQQDQPLCEGNKEELVVNSLANSLTQVFRDNEWILPYLIKKLN